MTASKPVKLTPKQERFCQLVALEGAALVEAYRQAYDASRMTDKTAHESASKLAADPKVSARIDAIKAEIQTRTVEKELWSRLDSINVLKDIATDQEARGNEKVSAVKELNAMHGFSTSKVELTGDLEIRAELEHYRKTKEMMGQLTTGQKLVAAIAGVHTFARESPDEHSRELLDLVDRLAKLLAGTSARADLVESCKRVLSDLEGYAFD